MLKDISSASPRTSGLDNLVSTVKKFSRWVCILKVAELSGTGMHRNDSSGEMAEGVAERMPYLSQVRYLEQRVED